MRPDQTRALTAIVVFAAFSDGRKSDIERAKVREIVEGLGDSSTTEAVRRVLLKQTTVSTEAALLDTDDLRSLAWESSLAVCESDGQTSGEERAFLEELALALGRPRDGASKEIEAADAITAQTETRAGLERPAPLPILAPVAVTGAGPEREITSAAAGSAHNTLDPRDAQVDASVLRYAILTSAIELMPQNLATLAIIPLQTKMVYGVGKSYGHELGASSIKEFVATIGIGVTGQAVEQYARKFLGKLLGKGGGLLGGTIGGIGKTAVNWGTGPLMTFATTYAMGAVAKQYYKGGRSIRGIDLKSMFASETERARELYAKYEPQVRETAAKTNPTELLKSLRGA